MMASLGLSCAMDQRSPKAKPNPTASTYQDPTHQGLGALPRKTKAPSLDPKHWAQRFPKGPALPPETFQSVVVTHPLEWVLGALQDVAKDLKTIANDSLTRPQTPYSLCAKSLGGGGSLGNAALQRFDLGSCQDQAVLVKENLETYEHVLEVMRVGYGPAQAATLLAQVPFTWGQRAPWTALTHRVYVALGLEVTPAGGMARGTLSALGSPSRPFEFHIDPSRGTMGLNGDLHYHLNNGASNLWVHVSFDNFEYGELDSPLGAHMGYTTKSSFYGSYKVEANGQKVELTGRGEPCLLVAQETPGEGTTHPWDVDVCK